MPLKAKRDPVVEGGAAAGLRHWLCFCDDPHYPRGQQQTQACEGRWSSASLLGVQGALVPCPVQLWPRLVLQLLPREWDNIQPLSTFVKTRNLSTLPQYPNCRDSSFLSNSTIWKLFGLHRDQTEITPGTTLLQDRRPSLTPYPPSTLWFLRLHLLPQMPTIL